MEINSKLGIYKLTKVEPPNGGSPFYKAVVFEKVYNAKNPFTKYETAFYDEAYIFNMDLDLEPADFSLNKNEKDKYSYDNIANPDKSIIRVVKFKFEKHTVWRGREQQKDQYGKAILKPIFYLLEIEPNSSKWVNEEGRVKKLQTKIDALTISFQKKEQGYKDKINDLKEKIKSLERSKESKDRIIEKHKNKIVEGKNRLKEAHYETMVYKRQNTITNNTLERTQQKLNETNQDLRRVKKMKKAEVIQKANEFIDSNFAFDDI